MERRTVQLARLDGFSDSILVADGTASGVDEPCALFEVLEKVGVDEPTGTFVEGAVDGDDIALRDEFLKALDAASVDGLGGGWYNARQMRSQREERVSELTLRERSVVVVEELFAVEGKQTLKDTVTNTPSTDGTNDLALQVKGVAGDIRDLPFTTLDHLSVDLRTRSLTENPRDTYLVSRNKVPDEEEDGHDDVLSDRDDVGAGDFQNLDAVLDSGVEINVIRANTSSDTELQLLGLVEEVSSEVSGVERCGDQDLSLDKLQ